MKKITAYILSGALSLTALTGCGTSEEVETIENNTETAIESNELTPVRVSEVVHSVFYAPQYVATQLNYFEDEGLDVTFTVGNGADVSMTALISDTADIALLGTEAGIYVYNEGMEDYPKAFLQLTQRAGNFLVAREEMPNFEWSDLVGKSVIGGRVGGMPQMVFEYVLQENGITPFEDIEIINNIDFTSTAGAFTGDVGDFTVEFEPVATTLVNNNTGFIVESLGESAGDLPYTVYMAQDDFLNNNEETIKSFTRAIYKAQQWVATHTAKEIASVILAEFPENDLETLTTIVERYKSQDTWTTTPYFGEDGFERIQDIMEYGGELSKRVPFSDLVINDYAEFVISE